MKYIIYFLAAIGGLCLICTFLFLAIGIVNTWNYNRSVRKENKE